jgi:hypothetical protein
MRFSKAVCTLFLPLPFCLYAAAQIPAPRGSSTSAERVRERNEADLQRRMWEMRHLEERLRAATEQPRMPAPEPKLSDEEKQRILKLRKVDPADIEKYKALLKQDDAGIFKIFPDLGCVSKTVVRIAPECAGFVPLSSSFTFRTNNYSDDVYHDIHYEKERIVSNSFFSQGVFVTVGDEPIEAIDLSHPAIKYLVSIAPDTDPKSAKEHARVYSTGLESAGYKFADNFVPQANATYAMRMMAYRLSNPLKPMSDETSTSEMMFHSLTFDKRVDIVVLFRVLRRDENSGLTIVWKQLSRADAGKIKFGKNEPLKDFRPDESRH